MGYQGGRRHRDEGRYSANRDRGGDRYRGQGDYGRDGPAYRHGTRGRFGGPDYRRPPGDHDCDDRGFTPYAGERSGYGDEDHGNRVRTPGPQQDHGRGGVPVRRARSSVRISGATLRAVRRCLRRGIRSAGWRYRC